MAQDQRRAHRKVTLEAGVVFAIVVTSIMVGIVTYRYSAHTSLLAMMLQFALGGWPNQVEQLSPGWRAVGASLQTLFALGIPFALVKLLHKLVERSLPMLNREYHDRRDTFFVIQFYTLLKQRVEAHPIESVEECEQLAQTAVATARQEWKKHLNEASMRHWEEMELGVDLRS